MYPAWKDRGQLGLVSMYRPENNTELALVLQVCNGIQISEDHSRFLNGMTLSNQGLTRRILGSRQVVGWSAQLEVIHHGVWLVLDVSAL